MKKFDKKFGDEFAEAIPGCAGVYRFFSASGEIIYVGKAKNLRRRLGQYRNAKRCKKHLKMREIVKYASKLDYEVCANDLEACLLENRLIQQLRPRFNVSGAFSFLYPMIGFRNENHTTFFCYTTTPEAWADFELHGAYRSRLITGEAFFSMMKLFGYLGHRESGNSGKRRGRGYEFRFRSFDSALLGSLREFLSGKNKKFLEELILALVEKAGARNRAVETQEHLRIIARFWRHEARILGLALKETKFSSYPLPQSDRDPVFIRFRDVEK